MTEHAPREQRTFWVWNGWDEPGPREAVGVATSDPGMWWFPDEGQPGWGASMGVGRGAFETRDAALGYHLSEARSALKHAQERVAKIEGMVGR